MFRLGLVAIAFLLSVANSVDAQDKLKDYPISLKADDVHEIATLSIEANALKLTGHDLLVIPIHCERGITGAMVIGNGEFVFSPADGEEVKGAFRAAMLRFDPADQPKLLPLEKTNVVTDRAAYEMSRHLLKTVFNHCWQSSGKALIPDTGSFVANVYSKTHGDLLISTGPNSTVVHNFTESKTVYQSK